jgi:two-component system, chemotaxis family, protein-glutamate methylesterase/glutaminase
MIDNSGGPSSFTCPRCGGAIWELHDQLPLVFRCRIDHTFSAANFLAAHAAARAASVERARLMLAEGGALKRHLARRAREMAYPHVAEQFDAEAARLEDDAAALEGFRPSRAT